MADPQQNQNPQPQQHQQHSPGHHPGHGLGGSQFGDTTLTKIFVGGLAWETQRDTMRQYFEQFGDILEAVVITDKNTGRSKGYGFVTFKDPESAKRACENPTPIIDGRRANCNLAALGVRQRFPPFHQAGRVRHFAPVLGSSQVPSSSSFPQVPAPFSYPQGFSYAPYGYAYVPSEYSYQSLYNPYGNPTQVSASVYGSSGTSSTVMSSNPAAVYTYAGFNTYPPPLQTSYSSSSSTMSSSSPVGHHQVMHYPPPPPPPPFSAGGYNPPGAAAAPIAPAPAGGASGTGLTSTHPTQNPMQQQQQRIHSPAPGGSSSSGPSSGQ